MMDAIKLSGVGLILAISSPAYAQPLSHSEANSLSPQFRSLGRIWIRAASSSPDDPTGDTGSGGLPTALWIPVIVLPLTLLGALVFYWRSIMRFLGIRLGSQANAQRASTSARPRTSQSGEQRVLTAEQLANAPSTTNLVNNGATPSGSGEPRPQRRRRRPRRTPSQMSTRSLPPYMAQAGEQELVLARARPDEEEEEEDGSSSEGESGEGRPSHGDVSTPLLPESGQSRSQAPAAGEPAVRPSMDSHMSSQDTHVTNRSSMRLIDVRGEAPPYFEVVDESTQGPNPTDIEQGHAEPTPPSSFRMPAALRRLLPWGSSGASQTGSDPQPQLPMRQVQSQVSLPLTTIPTNSSSQHPSPNPSRISNRSSHRLGHMPSSPSLSNLLARTRSNSNARQPSNHSPQPSRVISPPLPHSLVRASFAYPAGGPTPEQMAFLSSTASLIRFGVPLNDDGTEVLQPPPNFADIVNNGTNASQTSLNPSADSHQGSGNEDPSTTTQDDASSGHERSDSGSSLHRAALSVSTHSLIRNASSTNLEAVEELPTPISPANSISKRPQEPELTRSSSILSTTSRHSRLNTVHEREVTEMTVRAPVTPTRPTVLPESVPLPETPVSPSRSSIISSSPLPRIPAPSFPSTLQRSNSTSTRHISASSIDTFATADTHLTNATETPVQVQAPASVSRQSSMRSPGVVPGGKGVDGLPTTPISIKLFSDGRNWTTEDSTGPATPVQPTN